MGKQEQEWQEQGGQSPGASAWVARGWVAKNEQVLCSNIVGGMGVRELPFE